MNALSYLRMVLWSFFGIRRRASAGRELPNARPGVLIATAFGMAALFVLTLITIVRHVAGV